MLSHLSSKLWTFGNRLHMAGGSSQGRAAETGPPGAAPPGLHSVGSTSSTCAQRGSRVFSRPVLQSLILSFAPDSMVFKPALPILKVPVYHLKILSNLARAGFRCSQLRPQMNASSPLKWPRKTKHKRKHPCRGEHAWWPAEQGWSGGLKSGVVSLAAELLAFFKVNLLKICSADLDHHARLSREFYPGK